MKNYRNLLFDLDDTLLDFGAAEKQALPKIFETLGVALTDEVRAKYKEINTGLWQALEEGTITREQLMEGRFAITLKHFGVEVDGKAVDARYRSFLAESKVFVEGAFDIIQQLSKDYDLYIVSNGISETQHKRLHHTGLYPYFKGIFVSEDTGYQKPMKPFFDYVFERIANFDLKETLIIGDSFSADMIGGAGAGIDTCWLNPSAKQNTTTIQPTYEIRKLMQLHGILGKKVCD